jgi:hypothetical protein
VFRHKKAIGRELGLMLSVRNISTVGRPVKAKINRGGRIVMNHSEDGKEEPRAITALTDYLNGLEPGPVPDSGCLETLFAPCWEDLAGSSDGGMEGNKLFGRMESVEWWPPLLTFKIERHGGASLGSSRAELQHWAVDISKRIACLGGSSHRQLRPSQSRLDVKPLANAVARSILSRQRDEYLKWFPDGHVLVSIGKLIPVGGPKQTIAGRRKRFRTALDAILKENGWEKVRANTYRPSNSTVVLAGE